MGLRPGLRPAHCWGQPGRMSHLLAGAGQSDAAVAAERADWWGCATMRKRDAPACVSLAASAV